MLLTGVLQAEERHPITKLGYVTELIWHRVFGEPWLMPAQDQSLVFPDGEPASSTWPTPSRSATITPTPLGTESQQPFT